MVRVRHVPDGGHPPEDRAHEDGRQRDPDAEELDADAAEHVPDLLVDRPDPGLDVGRVPLEQRRFLPQRQHDGSEQLGLSEQAPELLLPSLRRRAAGGRVLRQLAKAGHQRAARLPQRLDLGAQLLSEIGCPARQLPERAPRALERQQTIREGPDAGGRRPGESVVTTVGAPVPVGLSSGTVSRRASICSVRSAASSWADRIDLGQLRRRTPAGPAGARVGWSRRPAPDRARAAQPRVAARACARSRATSRSSRSIAARSSARRSARAAAAAGSPPALSAAPAWPTTAARARAASKAREHGPLRRLLLAAVGVGVEGAPEPLHDDPRAPGTRRARAEAAPSPIPPS